MSVKVRQKQKGSGEWWIFIDHNGIRKAKKIGPKFEAERIAAIIAGRLASGDLGILENKTEIKTVKEYSSIWLHGTVKVTKAPSTAYDYACIVKKHIVPSPFSNKPVDEVTKGEIKRFLLGKLSSGLSVSTVVHIKNVLGGIFREAMEDEIIQQVPSHGITIANKKTMTSRKPQIEPLEVDEVNRLLDTCEKEKPHDYPLLLLLISSGLRIGEAVCLQWRDIDFDDRTIMVRRGFVRNQVENTTKNGKDRIVDMTEQLTNCFRELKSKHAEKALKDGKGSIAKSWLFGSTIVDKPIDYQSWRKKHFYPLLEKAEIRRVRIHDLRHTYASIMLSTGCDLFYISRQLGHHSIKVTADVYGHLLKGNKEKPVDKLADLLATNRNLYATKNKKRVSANR